MTPEWNDPALLRNCGWIGGQEVRTERRFRVCDPATGDDITLVCDLDAKHAEMAIEVAHQAFMEWRLQPPRDRVKPLQQWAKLIREHVDDLGTIIAAESGKPIAQAKGEAGQCASLLDWFADRALAIDDQTLSKSGETIARHITKQPVGVVACITPWNFPAAAVAVKAGAAIAAGCTVVLKPSEDTPLIALALASLASRAGLPDGVLNIVPCREPTAVGNALLGSNTVRMVSFTGSTAVGKHIYASSAHSIKRLALELGGNAPFVVFDDADLDHALDCAMGARFYNSGQICVGANRFIVHADIYETFTQQLAARVSSLVVGPGTEPDTDVGPMINQASIDRLNVLVDDALSKGAHRMTDESQVSLPYFSPTVLGNASSDMDVFRSEVFGPLACVYAFSTEQEALSMANDTDAGLAAYVFTSDAERLERFVRDLEAGVIGANTANIFSNDLPFGGIKHSGLGREHGFDCLDEYLNMKSVCRET